MPDAPFAYDVIAYPGDARPQLQPSRLAPIAWLHGIPAAPPSRCRFLEVGCGDAASLLPIALAYPDAQVVGIDLAPGGIAEGNSYATRIGLKNCQFEAADLTTWKPPLEQFDYIVAHGFYSWVPPFVRDALFTFCRDRLAPGGVAYISYNALPGCHIRRMIWDMLRFHVRDIQEPAKRIEQAMAFLQFLAAGAFGNDADLLKKEAMSMIQTTHPSVLFHDDLAEINDPVSIIQFMDHASRFGLQFLSEAEYFAMTPDLAPQGTGQMLKDLAEKNLLLKEQYLDYLKLRRFRMTLLCHSTTPRSVKPDPDVIRKLSVTCQAETIPSSPTFAPGERVQFKAPKGAVATFEHEFINAAFVTLTDNFPHTLSFDELVEAAHHLLGNRARELDAAYRTDLTRVLVESYRIGLVELLAEPPPYARTAKPKPVASPLARLQLADGRETVTGLRPSVIGLESPITRELVTLLDGTRDRAALLMGLAARAAANPACHPPDTPPQSADWWRNKLADQIEPALAMTAKNGLLMEM
jgi:SAM-dependent methyltransferase